MTSTHHFGDALRVERQSRSVSLEEIAQTTKVTVRSLQALESEAFDQLPGGILGKGIVRSYVRCLGLDENEWVTRFLAASGQATDTDTAATVPARDWVAFALNVSTRRVRGNGAFRLRWAGVVALLLLLCALGWIVWGFVHRRVASLPHASFGTHAALLSSAPLLRPADAVRCAESHIVT